jgi:hypothetical protein
VFAGFGREPMQWSSFRAAVLSFLTPGKSNGHCNNNWLGGRRFIDGKHCAASVAHNSYS